ncbi:hypothetical protein BO94DRAFT_614214 [Aspergillus sclerotioniger CBS 115572]|uniref:Deoxyribonuclease NucA/NucB domain-containing protein n=1 Tax=Aspergillus sclerotioniger CBS 115572 TaxID=1450535 RepID=A0A317UVN3_9EURO|nr:hypothetical protein BO94DRAFT_614214 [Aspergillus sclerotioniger CBS 115572]PWY65685.1 hypothetical protein BO94DRAFT_614214 [Aspergillus sclerotioniger CBS 115572]
MRTAIVLLTALLWAPGFYQVLAFPTGTAKPLEARSTVGNTKSNPIQAEIEIRGEDALTYDVDCWAMLCKGKPAIMQKTDTKAADKHRQVKNGSAAKKQPFVHRAKYGIKSSPPTSTWANNQGWVSAEEFPFASTVDGGAGAILVGVTLNSQEEQKNSLHSFYSKNKIQSYNATAKGSDRSWFEITGFKVTPGKTAIIGPYCKAFNAKDKGNLCSASTKVVGDWGFDVAEYAYVYNHQTKTFDYVGK